MNTTELLAIIAPHREMLKGMGVTDVDAGQPQATNIVCIVTNGEMDIVSATHAARILECVARHAMDDWQVTGQDEPHREYRMEPRTDGDTFGIISDGDNHEVSREPHSLAVALALLAWTRTQKGTT